MQKPVENSPLDSDVKESSFHDENPINADQMMVNKARNRMNLWAADTVDNPELLVNLRKGLVTKHTVHNHQFRDRNKSMETTTVPFISRKYGFLISFKTALQRANDQEQYYKEVYLKKEPYNQRVSKTGIERVREKNKELGHDLVYGYRTENERVNRVVEFNSQKDPTDKDISMLHFPKWKHDIKSEWVSVVCQVSSTATFQN